MCWFLDFSSHLYEAEKEGNQNFCSKEKSSHWINDDRNIHCVCRCSEVFAYTSAPNDFQDFARNKSLDDSSDILHTHTHSKTQLHEHTLRLNMFSHTHHFHFLCVFFLSVCQIMPKGVVSVIGPASSPASGSTVSHICGEKEVSQSFCKHAHALSFIRKQRFMDFMFGLFLDFLLTSPLHPLYSPQTLSSVYLPVIAPSGLIVLTHTLTQLHLGAFNRSILYPIVSLHYTCAVLPAPLEHELSYKELLYMNHWGSMCVTTTTTRGCIYFLFNWSAS